MAVLEIIRGGMFGKVYPGLLDVTVKSGIEDGLKLGGGCGC